MEEIRCVLEEAAKDIDGKLERTESSEKEEYVDGGSDEDLLGISRTSDEDMVITRSSDEDQGKMKKNEDDDETEEDDYETEEEWHEDDGRWLPNVGRNLPPRSTCFEGAGCTMERAKEIVKSVYERNATLFGEWVDLHENNDNNKTPRPARPLEILPEITGACTSGYVCYHRKYWTDITSETEPNHPYFRPCEMLQVFSLKLLSETITHPVKIYGTFAVRDCWEPCCNFLFNRSREDSVTVVPGSHLPLCSPCRGIFVLQYLLIDSDLWIKEEGQMSADKPLFSGYVELDAQFSGFQSRLNGRIPGDCYDLEMRYAFLYEGIETFIEVAGETKHPQSLQISAFTGSLDDEIGLYSGMFHGHGVMVRHFIAVRKLEKLHILLKLDGSVHTWTLQAGVGVLAEPGGPIPGFDQLAIHVSYRTRGKTASAWNWKCVGDDVHVMETCPEVV